MFLLMLGRDISQDAEDEVSEWFVRDEAKFNLVKWSRVCPGIVVNATLNGPMGKRPNREIPKRDLSLKRTRPKGD